MKSLTRWTTIATLPMFMAMALFAPEVLHLLFGQPYTTAATVLTLLSFGYLYSASVGHLGAILKSVSETKILFKNSVFNFFLNTILNLVLIPEWGLGLGMLGAAIATTTSILVMNTIIVAEVYHVKGFTPFNRKVWKPIAASIPALLLTYLGLQLIFPAGTPVWAMIPGGAFYAGLYGLTFLALGGLEEDRKSIQAAGRKFGYEDLSEKLLRTMERLSLL
ncbi:MAG: polysaccharide biosynthesis C-terminal domain-containing protein [Candidatus Nanohaloarchaea archaeon]